MGMGAIIMSDWRRARAMMHVLIVNVYTGRINDLNSLGYTFESWAGPPTLPRPRFSTIYRGVIPTRGRDILSCN
jgi:hypothetical protein